MGLLVLLAWCVRSQIIVWVYIRRYNRLLQYEILGFISYHISLSILLVFIRSQYAILSRCPKTLKTGRHAFDVLFRHTSEYKILQWKNTQNYSVFFPHLLRGKWIMACGRTCMFRAHRIWIVLRNPVCGCTEFVIYLIFVFLSVWDFQEHCEFRPYRRALSMINLLFYSAEVQVLF